jgi:glycosyltransferase involved in cell wall biosynthesis
MFFYPNSMIGKCLKLSEFTIYPYSGTVFCVSHRQVLMLRGFVDRMCYLPPCIPSSYHINPSQKKRNLPLNISFLGRIDPRKGVLETLDLFEKLAHNSSYNCRIYGIYIPRDGQATAIHHRLKRQSLIQYIEVERQAYSGSTEELALSVLRDSDIFVQPYRSMDSTVDSPLLLLEAMASSCAVLTTPIADVPRLYGDSNFVIQNQQFAESALHLLMHLSPGTLTEEQNRSHKQLTHMELAPASIAKKMLDATE